MNRGTLLSIKGESSPPECGNKGHNYLTHAKGFVIIQECLLFPAITTEFREKVDTNLHLCQPLLAIGMQRHVKNF